MEQQFRKEMEELERQHKRKNNVSCQLDSFKRPLTYFQEYESRIESLQRQVDLAQSMISSSCSTWDGGGELILSKSLLAEVNEEHRWSPEEERVVRRAALKWRYHQFTSVRDDLWGNAIFLKGLSVRKFPPFYIRPSPFRGQCNCRGVAETCSISICSSYRYDVQSPPPRFASTWRGSEYSTVFKNSCGRSSSRFQKRRHSLLEHRKAEVS